MRLKRSHLIHFVDANMRVGDKNWFKIGKDVQDLSVDMGAQITTVKNILDEVSAQDNGYEPSIEVNTYYCDTADPIYEPLASIAMNRETGEKCRSYILEVMIEDTEATKHKAWLEDCIIKPNSYGGEQGGVRIPYKIGFDGNRVKGYVEFTDGVPTFTEGDIPASSGG